MAKTDSTTKTYAQEAERAARAAEMPAAQPRQCDEPGCDAPGTYRAPKNPQAVDSGPQRDCHWFCLPHVQAYNKNWNFYRDFSLDELTEARRQDVLGWRPTWPLGKLGPADRHENVKAEALRAHIYHTFFGRKAAAQQARRAATATALSGDEQAAYRLFNLAPGASWYEVKAKYRLLVKQYHPDLHAEAAAVAEETLKQINRAYAVLKKRQNIAQT